MMLKKLIPAAVLLAVGGAAQAQMTVYGLIDLSYGKSDYVGTANASKSTFHSGGDDGSSQGNSTSKFGLKGAYDVGSGLKANFQLESNGITSDGDIGSPFFGRQAWAGLSGSFGEVRLGRQDSVSFQTLVPFDLNGAANAVSAQYAVGIGSAAGRQSRSLQYIAPAMGGFKVQAGFNAKDPAVATAKSAYALGASYTVGALTVAAAYDGKRTENGDATTGYSAAYDFGVAKAVFTRGKTGVANKGNMFGVVAPIAGFNVGVQYAKNSVSDAKAFEYFVNKEILKNTFAYVDYGTRKTGAVKDTAYAAGVIYAF